jgi:hypothetical protein
MARRESFDKLALRTITGTPFTSADFYRIIPSTGMGEYVKIRGGRVVEFIRESHDEEAIQKQIELESSKVVKSLKHKKSLYQNGLEYRGTVLILGSPVEFYGSEKSWKKFIEEEV